MAGAIGAFMSDFACSTSGISDGAIATNPASRSGSGQHPVRVASLKDRRKVMASVRNLIAELISGENNYIQNVPENLRSSENYELAEERLTLLEEVFETIREIYS